MGCRVDPSGILSDVRTGYGFVPIEIICSKQPFQSTILYIEDVQNPLLGHCFRKTIDTCWLHGESKNPNTKTHKITILLSQQRYLVGNEKANTQRCAEGCKRLSDIIFF